MSKIKLSIIFTVFNSHEIVRRQIEYFKSLNLPDDIEIIMMDDESNPPLEFPNCGLKNFRIYKTGNKAPWTQALARNQSIKYANGDMLLMTDIDHFFPLETIIASRDYDGDKMMFKREFAILDEDGKFKQDRKTLIEYGFRKTRARIRGFRHGLHVNSFVMRKWIYEATGGYEKRFWENRFHRSGDGSFWRRYKTGAKKGKWKQSIIDHMVYTFPGANPDKLGLFHDLNRQDEAVKENKL